MLILADPDLFDLANQLGQPIAAEPEDLLAYVLDGEEVDGLVYMRNLVSPAAVADPWKIHNEVLLMKTLSLMSDMWDIPFVAVMWGSSRLMPTNSNGVWWATLEGAIHARKSLIIRTNGLFGPDVQNQVLAALESDKPVFDASHKISPLPQEDLLFEIRAFIEGAELRSYEQNLGWPGMVFLGYETGNELSSWYDVASGVLVHARPWVSDKYKTSSKAGKRFQQPGPGHGHPIDKWDASWDTPRHGAPVEPLAQRFRVVKDASWLGRFATLAKEFDHELVKGVEDILFV